MQQTVLEVKNLTKTYPSGLQALKGISANVKEGEFLVVIGLSGSGKSTLLRCINHLHEPTTGTILYRGEDISRPDALRIRRLRGQIAMIFQQFNLVPRHTVMSNVLTGALARTGTFRALAGSFASADVELAQQNLELVGLADKKTQRADRLSGGQQQRVAIARALMQHPDILLADEPVASLDPATCHVVMDYLRRINKEKGITVVCNLHFLSLVREYADRVIALRKGELVFEGTPAGIDDVWFKHIYGEAAREVHVE